MGMCLMATTLRPTHIAGHGVVCVRQRLAHLPQYTRLKDLRLKIRVELACVRCDWLLRIKRLIDSELRGAGLPRFTDTLLLGDEVLLRLGGQLGLKLALEEELKAR